MPSNFKQHILLSRSFLVASDNFGVPSIPNEGRTGQKLSFEEVVKSLNSGDFQSGTRRIVSDTYKS